MNCLQQATGMFNNGCYRIKMLTYICFIQLSYYQAHKNNISIFAIQHHFISKGFQFKYITNSQICRTSDQFPGIPITDMSQNILALSHETHLNGPAKRFWWTILYFCFSTFPALYLLSGAVFLISGIVL